MASHLSRIIGTEEDRVNCPFYYKIGACRHGDRCSRTHLRPTFSQNLLIPHMYIAPPPNPDGTQDEEKAQEHFEEFFEEIAEEFMKFGEVELINVVENLGDHMFGNVYVTYRAEEEAEAALKALTGRYYAGRILMPEYSPVTDFREARCRQFEESICSRGGFCNFVHLKRVPRHLRKLLRKSKKKKKKKDKDRRRSRSRSKSGGKDKGKERGADAGGAPGGGEDGIDFRRASSAERRNMFKNWNKKKTGGDEDNTKDRSRSRSPGGDKDKDRRRSRSPRSRSPGRDDNGGPPMKTEGAPPPQ
eukprot:gb/GEZN01006775.1/.p1 GENE.gb/GEZN01006775.1/~~gb/GEZN01006775.1/.p1  ORF type:complete len:302 (+),score=45.81 gb/GEZN01006775.1/:150-1055(+)